MRPLPDEHSGTKACNHAHSRAYGRAGQPEAGLLVLAEALPLMATTEARWWDAEV
jgi:hypothetical protein